MPDFTLFRNDIEGSFIARPNRFCVIVRTSRGEVKAHCPNPGRMRELLIPGRRCILEHHPETGRKTAWSLAAVDYNGVIVPLNSAGANNIAEKLLIPQLFPEAEAVRREFSTDKSRFDFLIESETAKTLLEVKSCNLVEQGTAMFPDAPTSRGARHVTELAKLSESGEYRCAVLFVVVNPNAYKLVPGIHTDPAFAAALYASSRRIEILAAAVNCDITGNIQVSNRALPVDLTPCAAAVNDSGVYLLRLQIDSDREICIGALGPVIFPAGIYVYVGSAMKNLSSRVARHLRKRKKKHWHIDYLLESADRVEAFPVRTEKFLECRLAQDVAEIAEAEVHRFGCSDCSCRTHLFRIKNLNPDDPLSLERLLLRYRHHEAL